MPFISSGRTAVTVTVPPVTVVLIRARTLPTTRPAGYSIVALAGTEIVLQDFLLTAPPQVFRRLIFLEVDEIDN